MNLIEEKQKKNITLIELKNDYLNHVKNKIDADTYKSKETKLNHFCELDNTNQVQTFPNKLINSFTKEMYIKWQTQMKAKTYKKGQCGKQSFTMSIDHLNRIHNEICAMLDYGQIENKVVNNFAKQVGKFGTPKEITISRKSRKYEVIDYEEYLKLMEVTKNDPTYNTLFDLWFSRGPRPGEVRAFRILDYNYEKKQLTVNHTLSKSNELKEPKTASSKASIDLDDNLNEKINNLINILKKQPDFNNHWYIFNGATPISSNSMEHNKNKYFELAKINKHLRLHDFRHSCATWLFSIGIPITVISKILRHKDISITMSTYTHLMKKDYDNALNKLNNIKQDKKQDQNKF